MADISINLHNTIHNIDGLELLKQIPDHSIDLILTDPPYITSRESGMNKLYESGTTQDQTYGRKYAIKTDYGDWDKNFTLEQLDNFIKEYHRVLKPHGTCIIFFDLWKLTNLADLMTNHNFKQLRFIEWIKTNPMPINAKINYLTNAREIAITAVKEMKPTFNSEQDNGIYEYPFYSQKDRFHPTQKSIKLFENLIIKHSNEDDIVLDTFLGSGTTVLASVSTGRKYIGSELDETFFKGMEKRIEGLGGLGDFLV